MTVNFAVAVFRERVIKKKKNEIASYLSQILNNTGCIKKMWLSCYCFSSIVMIMIQ